MVAYRIYEQNYHVDKHLAVKKEEETNSLVQVHCIINDPIAIGTVFAVKKVQPKVY